MKIFLSSRGLFVLGFLVLVATNILVLAGVAANRSGAPEALTTLTERELRAPNRVSKENSGLSFRLIWRILAKDDDASNYPYYSAPSWLDAGKLEELGFELPDQSGSPDDSPNYKVPVAKEVYIVLEYDGALYREAVERAEAALARELASGESQQRREMRPDPLERARQQLQRERYNASRLFAVDAGLDPEKLRGRYNDRSRFIITKGQVSPGYLAHRKREKIFGRIANLSSARIHVSLDQRMELDSLLTRANENRDGLNHPRYEVELAYGNRLEPWIVSIRPTDEEPNR